VTPCIPLSSFRDSLVVSLSTVGAYTRHVVVDHCTEHQMPHCHQSLVLIFSLVLIYPLAKRTYETCHPAQPLSH
jgi:cbb3-type cytochrome oxidase subunit 1